MRFLVIQCYILLQLLPAVTPNIFAQTQNEGMMKIDENLIQKWSAHFQNWHYYPDFVISASLETDLNFTMVDGPNVYKSDDAWHILYFGYDGQGYQSCLAVSEDLVHWKCKGLVMGYGEAGAFDYGGVVLVGPLYDTHNLHQAPRLKKWQDKYWILYGCYPEQGGYELGHGGQGLAWSSDGFNWQRYSKTRPVLSVEGVGDWENRVIYSPCLIEHDHKFWNFYNAKGKAGREQIGFASSTDLLHWQRHPGNPVIRNQPAGYDALLAADAEIYWDHDHWIMFYFGASRNNPDNQVHAHIMLAFSYDLIHWTVNPEPLYKAGGHPTGLDQTHAHNVSLVYNAENDTYYLFYCAVGNQGRGIGLLTSKPL